MQVNHSVIFDKKLGTIDHHSRTKAQIIFSVKIETNAHDKS